MAEILGKTDGLYEVADDFLAVAREIVDDGDFNHGVCTGLLTHGSASHIDEHLRCEGRIVDAHVELEELIVRLAAHALAY